MTLTDSDREAFEAWAYGRGIRNFTRFPEGHGFASEYGVTGLQNQWLGYLAGFAAGAKRERHALLPLLRRWYDTYGGSTNGRGGKLVDAQLDAETLRALGDAP